MKLPTWAKPIEFCRTHAIRLCDCPFHYPAVVTVAVTVTRRVLAKDPAAKDKRYRQRKELNVHPVEEEPPQYEITSYDIEYHLCPVCYIWELEMQEVISYLASETLSTAYQAAFERVGYSYTDKAAQTINRIAERSYNAANHAKTGRKPKPKPQPAAAKQKETAAA